MIMAMGYAESAFGSVYMVMACISKNMTLAHYCFLKGMAIGDFVFFSG
jgi:hypothetical protein